VREMTAERFIELPCDPVDVDMMCQVAESGGMKVEIKDLENNKKEIYIDELLVAKTETFYDKFGNVTVPRKSAIVLVRT